MRKYDHQEIEAKWQGVWEKTGLFRVESDPEKKKFYALDMFPYPSGQGLHVGHPLGYIATDIIARKRRMEGWNVLHPMGWDAFGLPAENYAIKNGIPPRESTLANIANFRRTLQSLGLSYDWSREVNTCDPSYYKWTQWLFLFLYKRGLAYRGTAPVNWCETDHTVLANEQVIDGCCDRCKNPVIQKELTQWFFRVTDFADRLLDGLDNLDWPERIKAMQRNWIGRSEGVEIEFRGVDENTGKEFSLPVFTTRPDTLYGVAAVVIAPEHPLVEALVADEAQGPVTAYVQAAARKSELQRTGLEQEKTGVPLGVEVRHPLTGAHVPVWVADYVLANYGTGAVMVVPAHDDRDFTFAKTYSLPVKRVIAPPAGAAGKSEDAAYTAPGVLIDSEEFSGLTTDDAKRKIADHLESKGMGRRQVNYHLRDWLVSRQRYWGAPIPIIYCGTHGEVPVPESDLPVLLPDDVDFRPTGESPLTRSKSFQSVNCPLCGKPARRESDTMDTFVDSSWYFLRYPNPHYADRPFDSHLVNYWCPVDMYVGGAEHAVLHLLYARFFTKVLAEGGALPFDEPFTALRNQGLIMGEDGQKMSKSRGNVIPADSVVSRYGADTLRLYEMFMGEFTESKPWDTKGIVGVRRFLDKTWTLVHDAAHSSGITSAALGKLLQKTIKKVSEDIEAFKFNTAISSLMILANAWQAENIADKEFVGTFVRLLSPFAPHVAEELWSALGNKESVLLAPWPSFDAARAADDTIMLIVQINGKMRDKIDLPVGTRDEDVKAAALASEKVRAHLEGKSIAKVVVVGGKLINIVVE